MNFLFYNVSFSFVNFSSIWRRCLPEQNLERVTHFYSLAYGLALMICGLNILISREQTMNNQM